MGNAQCCVSPDHFNVHPVESCWCCLPCALVCSCCVQIWLHQFVQYSSAVRMWDMASMPQRCVKANCVRDQPRAPELSKLRFMTG